MTQKKDSIVVGSSVYPSGVSLTLIIVAVILSFVDLTFLNEVIGRVLDIGTTGSVAVSCALGLVGIAIMAHEGVMEAHGGETASSSVGHYMLWIFLGLAFVIIRLFSASILQLDNSLGDQSLVKFIGLNIRQVDFVLAPLMLLLYLTTGVMIKDGVKNLLQNTGYNNSWSAWIAKRKAETIERKRLEEEAKAKRLQEIAAAKATAEAAALKAKLDREYTYALDNYRKMVAKIKENYQKISANVSSIKSLDNQVKDFETKVKPSLLQIVQESIYSVQNNTALMIRKKTGEDSALLSEAIEQHNNGLRRQQGPIHNTQNDAALLLRKKTNEDAIRLRKNRLIR